MPLLLCSALHRLGPDMVASWLLSPQTFADMAFIVPDAVLGGSFHSWHFPWVHIRFD
jgi:hypothetical protein